MKETWYKAGRIGQSDYVFTSAPRCCHTLKIALDPKYRFCSCGYIVLTSPDNQALDKK